MWLPLQHTFAVLASLAAISSAIKPLKTWKICPRSDPNMNQCLKEAVQAVIPQLANGNAKLGLMPLEPLHFNELKIEQSTGPVAISLKFTHVDVTGISKVVIDRFEADWDRYHMEAEVHLDEPDQLTVVGDYAVDGKILALPIRGSGPCNVTFDKIKVKIVFDGKPLEKDGVGYADFDTVKIVLDTSRLHLLFENLFNGDKALGQQMNIFLNENWPQILDELKPGISKALGAAFSALTNTVFHSVPLSEIAPP